VDADAWDERYRATELVWGAEPNRFVREECEHLPPGRALDLGCGEGRNALFLARLGWQATGIDYSPVAIERAEKLTAEEPDEVRRRLTWQVGDVTTLDVPPEAYDLVLVSYIHLPPSQQEALFSMAAAAVALGGRLVVVGHDRRNLTEGVSGPQDETLLYDAAELRQQLTSAGLTVGFADIVERPTPDGVALDTLVTATRT
jgi:SAM-dependent methyltransferase